MLTIGHLTSGVCDLNCCQHMLDGKLENSLLADTVVVLAAFAFQEEYFHTLTHINS